jgi:hypothetical protein
MLKMFSATLRNGNLHIYNDNVLRIQKNTEALLDTSKEVGLEVNPEKTKYRYIRLPEERTKAWQIYPLKL